MPAGGSLDCTSVPLMYFRKSGQDGGAAVVQEKPSPPPSVTPGSPAPPSMVGNGNQPSLLAKSLSSVSAAMVPGSQSPCSSIAACPFATMPAELPAPCCAGVPRKPCWNGFVSRNLCMSSLALAKQPSLRSWFFIAVLSVSVEHSRSAKYSHQNASGQRSLPPMAIGA